MSRLSIVIFQTMVLLGLGEAGARFAERVRKPAGEVAFDYAPYRMLRMTTAPWTLNREGFRARDLETYRGTFLVEFLGGSVCLGVGTNAGAIVPDRIERRLHEAGMREASVLNLCQGGVTSAQELAIFLEYGLPLSPQVVLSFNGANDLMHPRPVGEDEAANLPYLNREIASRFDGHHSFADHMALIRVAGRIAARWLPNGSVRASSASPSLGVPPTTVLNSYLYTTDVLRTLTEAQRGWYAVLLQPTLHFEKPWSDEERRMWKERQPGDGAAVSRYVHQLYGSASESLGEWSAETGAGLFDLSRAFSGTHQTVYSDSVHFTGGRGYETLEQELVRQGLIRKIAERYRLWERRREAGRCPEVRLATLAHRIGLNSESYRLVRAMAATGSASVLSGLLSLASAKVVAAMLGPAGVALLATLQQTRQTAVTAASMNGQTSLVRGIAAGSREGEEHAREFVRSVLLLFAVGTALVSLIMLASPGAIAKAVGLGVERAPLLRLLAIPVALTSFYVFLTSLVNAVGAIRRLALLQLVSPLAMVLLAYPMCRSIESGSETSLVWLLTIAAGSSVFAGLVALRGYRSTLQEWFRGAGRWWTAQASREFLAVAGSMALTGLLGSAAVLAARSRILSAEGFATAGRFDAAWSISMNQATLVLASMQSYYLPAMARAGSNAERATRLAQTLRLGAMVAGALIVVAAAFKPALLNALYSPDFEPGARYLRWTLLGDYLKVASWILSIPMLAAADMGLFLASGVAAYGTFLVASAVLGYWTSWAEGTSIAFVLMYVVHLIFCGAVAWRRYAVRLDSATLAIWIAGLAAVGGTSVLFWNVP